MRLPMVAPIMAGILLQGMAGCSGTDSESYPEDYLISESDVPSGLRIMASREVGKEDAQDVDRMPFSYGATTLWVQYLAPSSGDGPDFNVMAARWPDAEGASRAADSMARDLGGSSCRSGSVKSSEFFLFNGKNVNVIVFAGFEGLDAEERTLLLQLARKIESRNASLEEVAHACA